MTVVINGELLEMNNTALPEQNEYNEIAYNSDFFNYLYDNQNNLFSDTDTITITIDNENYTIINIIDNYYDSYYYYITEGIENIDSIKNEIIDNEFFYTHDNNYCVNINSNEDFYCCDDCGGYYHYDDITHTEDDYYYCYHCNANFFYCEGCNNYYSTHIDYHYDEEDDCYYCDGCYEEQDASININTSLADTTQNEVIGTIQTTQSNYNAISSYHNYNRSFIFRKLDNENTNEFYGVELETENKSNNYDNDTIATYVLNNLNCVCASDGSLNNGFEIISDPQSFNYWLSRKSKIEKVFEELTKNGIRSDETDTCGLHIHVSRQALGDTQEKQEEIIARTELIIQNFKEQIKSFSRRNGNYGYCKFLSDLQYIDLSLEDIKIKKKDETGNRYQVINVNNSNTIEFRVFKGTLNITSFYASLQLVHNIIQLAKMDDYKGKSWNYLITMNNYKELQNYVKTRNIKSALKIKDYTIQLHNKRLKQDKKMKALYEKQNVIIKCFQDYAAKNIYIINQIHAISNNGIVNSLACMTSQNKLIELKNLSRVLRDTSDCLSYLDYNNYKTLEETSYKIYNDEKLHEYIKQFKDTIKKFKMIIKEEK